MIESRQIFQTNPVQHRSQELNEWQRQKFKSDDDFVLPISIYLENGAGHAEIIETVTQAARAYGFTNIIRSSQAPGSFFFRMEVGFESKNRHEAQQQKRKLTKALVGNDDLPDNTPEERRAVKKVKQSLLGRLKKSLSAITIGSVLLLAGHAVLDASKDTVKDALKGVIKVEAKQSIRKADIFIAKELPPSQAQRFHDVVKSFIDSSPNKECK